MHSDSLPLSEELVVRQAQARHSASFQELVRRYERRLLYYARRMLANHEEALDATQEIWLLVFRKLPKLACPAAFRVWLYKLGHDVCVSRLRRRRESIELPAELAISDSLDAWNELVALEQAERVHVVLAQLPPAHREVLTLRFLEDLTVAEIAQVISCPEGTVKSRLFHAKEALRRQLGDHPHD